MTIIYQRRMRKKKELAQKQAIALEQAQKCQVCEGNLKVADNSRSDRATYVCDKCGHVITFIKKVKKDPADKKMKRLSTLTLRDRTTPAYKQDVRKNRPDHDIRPSLAKIRQAMDEKKVLSFLYSSNGNEGGRTVEPYKLTLQGGDISLFGFDLEANGIRVFKVESISKISLQDFSFEPRWPIEDTIKRKTDEQPVEL